MRVINGGRSGAAANGAGPTARAFKKHPLADALYTVLNAGDVPLKQLRAGMSKVSRKQGLTLSSVRSAIEHVRENLEEYGWFPAFVRLGDTPMYWLQKGEKKVTATHLENFQAALVTGSRYCRTRVKRMRMQAQQIAETDGLDRRTQRSMNAIAGDLRSAEATMQRLVQAVSA